MATTPGLLFVTFQPEPGFPHAQFHDWYNNEHGPARLRIEYFQNGFRYRMRGDAKPSFMVIYHVTDVTGLLRHPYTTLRETGVKTERETEVMRHVEIKRGIFDRVYTKQSRDIPLQESGAAVVGERIKVPKENVDDFNKWYEDEHIALMSKIPGWIRTRRYSTYSADGAHPAEYLALHEYSGENGVDGPQYQAAYDTPWYHKVMGYGANKGMPLIWDKFYDFGPASRDLGSLHDPSAYFFQSRDGKTITWPIPGVDPSSSSPAYRDSRFEDKGWLYGAPSWPAIRSFFTTNDGMDLPYQLEGGGDPDAPLVVLANPALMDYRFWDAFVASFLSQPATKSFRVLRFNDRASSTGTTSNPFTISLLVSDLVALLDALNVRQAAVVIGVDLGSAVALELGARHAERTVSVVAANFGALAAPSYLQRCTENNEKASAGTALSGETRQELIKHWFREVDPADGRFTQEVSKIDSMLQVASKEQVEQAAAALSQFKASWDEKATKAKVLFVVGASDDALLKVSKDLVQSYGNDARVQTTAGKGGLAVVENPQLAADVMIEFVRQP